MNQEQVDHLNRVLEAVRTELTDKFIKGAKEHKTQLHKDYNLEQLLDMALEEAIDQIVYLYTMREKVRQQRNG